MRLFQTTALAAVLAATAFAAATAQVSENEVIGHVDALFAADRGREAVDLLHSAAAQGLPAAQAELAGLYFAGVYLAQDTAMAEKLLRDAVSDPKPEYKRDLACVLHHRGGPERAKESIQLIQEAAAAADLLAMVYESRLYRLGVERVANIGLANYKLEQALKRFYEPARPEDAETAFLRAHLPTFSPTASAVPPTPTGPSSPSRFRCAIANGRRRGGAEGGIKTTFFCLTKWI